MESPWHFATDADSDNFCRHIVADMVRLFEVSEQEAVGRVNRLWRGNDMLGEHDIAYHETPEYWAHVMYWGKESFWWITGDKRKQLGLGPIVPRPYP